MLLLLLLISHLSEPQLDCIHDTPTIGAWELPTQPSTLNSGCPHTLFSMAPNNSNKKQKTRANKESPGKLNRYSNTKRSSDREFKITSPRSCLNFRYTHKQPKIQSYQTPKHFIKQPLAADLKKSTKQNSNIYNQTEQSTVSKLMYQCELSLIYNVNSIAELNITSNKNGQHGNDNNIRRHTYGTNLGTHRDGKSIDMRLPTFPCTSFLIKNKQTTRDHPLFLLTLSTSHNPMPFSETHTLSHVLQIQASQSRNLIRLTNTVISYAQDNTETIMELEDTALIGGLKRKKVEMEHADLVGRADHTELASPGRRPTADRETAPTCNKDPTRCSPPGTTRTHAEPLHSASTPPSSRTGQEYVEDDTSCIMMTDGPCRLEPDQTDEISVSWAQATQLVAPIQQFTIALNTETVLCEALRMHTDNITFLTTLISRRPPFPIISSSRLSYTLWTQQKPDTEILNDRELAALYHYLYIVCAETKHEITRAFTLDSQEIHKLTSHQNTTAAFTAALETAQATGRTNNEARLQDLAESTLSGMPSVYSTILHSTRWTSSIDAAVYFEDLLLRLRSPLSATTATTEEDESLHEELQWNEVSNTTKTRIVLHDFNPPPHRTLLDNVSNRQRLDATGRIAFNVFTSNAAHTVTASELSSARCRAELIRHDHVSAEGHPLKDENILIIRERTHSDSHIYLSQYLLVHDFKPSKTLRDTMDDLLSAISLIGYSPGDDKLEFDNGLELDQEYAEARYADKGWSLLRNYKNITDITSYIIKLRHRALFGTIYARRPHNGCIVPAITSVRSTIYRRTYTFHALAEPIDLARLQDSTLAPPLVAIRGFPQREDKHALTAAFLALLERELQSDGFRRTSYCIITHVHYHQLMITPDKTLYYQPRYATRPTRDVPTGYPELILEVVFMKGTTAPPGAVCAQLRIATERVFKGRFHSHRQQAQALHAPITAMVTTLAGLTCEVFANVAECRTVLRHERSAARPKVSTIISDIPQAVLAEDLLSILVRSATNIHALNHMELVTVTPGLHYAANKTLPWRCYILWEDNEGMPLDLTPIHDYWEHHRKCTVMDKALPGMKVYFTLDTVYEVHHANSLQHPTTNVVSAAPDPSHTASTPGTAAARRSSARTSNNNTGTSSYSRTINTELRPLRNDSMTYVATMTASTRTEPGQRMLVDTETDSSSTTLTIPATTASESPASSALTTQTGHMDIVTIKALVVDTVLAEHRALEGRLQVRQELFMRVAEYNQQYRHLESLWAQFHETALTVAETQHVPDSLRFRADSAKQAYNNSLSRLSDLRAHILNTSQAGHATLQPFDIPDFPHGPA